MASLTYRAQTPDDPAFVTVDGNRFESGKAVQNVPDAIVERFKGNPWFTAGKAAREDAANRGAGAGLSPGPSSGIDSSVLPANPPGSGSKYGEEAVMTADGMVAAGDASLVDGANTLEDEGSTGKGRGRSKS